MVLYSLNFSDEVYENYETAGAVADKAQSTSNVESEVEDETCTIMVHPDSSGISDLPLFHGIQEIMHGTWVCTSSMVIGYLY